MISDHRGRDLSFHRSSGALSSLGLNPDAPVWQPLGKKIRAESVERSVRAPHVGDRSGSGLDERVDEIEKFSRTTSTGSSIDSSVGAMTPRPTLPRGVKLNRSSCRSPPPRSMLGVSPEAVDDAVDTAAGPFPQSPHVLPPDAAVGPFPRSLRVLSPDCLVTQMHQEIAAFDLMCRRMIADAAENGWPACDTSLLLDELRARAAFISPDHVLSPLLVMVYPTWQTYPGMAVHEVRARFALAEMVAAMVELRIMPRAQVLNALVALEGRIDWLEDMREVVLADQFMDELRARLDAWVPIWGHRG